MSIDRARRLRAEDTDAEKRFWAAVRNRKFMGMKFRRQVPVGRYVADFLCRDHRLIVEIDGGQHNPEVDAARTAVLEAAGYMVLRYGNRAVLTELEGVLGSIAHALGLYERFMGVERSGGEVVTPHPPMAAAMGPSLSLRERGREGHEGAREPLSQGEREGPAEREGEGVMVQMGIRKLRGTPRTGRGRHP